jgi:hypothetical protein
MENKIYRLALLLLIAIFSLDILFALTNPSEAYKIISIGVNKWSYIGFKLALLSVFIYAYWSFVKKGKNN